MGPSARTWRRWYVIGPAVALVSIVVAAGVAWATRDAWFTGLLVHAPSPESETETPPEDVDRVIEVARAGATIRAWVFDPEDCPDPSESQHWGRWSRHARKVLQRMAKDSPAA